MVAALRTLDDETAFLGTDSDPTFPDENGDPVPGSGAIIRAIAGVVEREPDQILGKPSQIAVEMALDRLDVSPADCLVIGDRLDTDIRMGERHEMTTALVLTGVADRENLATSDVEPDYVLESLGDVGQILDDLGSN